jgi:hypothetical protein
MRLDASAEAELAQLDRSDARVEVSRFVAVLVFETDEVVMLAYNERIKVLLL